MKRTYTTTLPDRVGAFMKASEIISSLGLNITRVSYNKAIDVHTLFIEAEGEQSALLRATELLLENGYLRSDYNAGSVILIEFKLVDVAGSVLPILKLIDSFNFNISYISSKGDSSEFQYFRMGLFVENEKDISDFIKKASLLCDLKIIDYDKTERVLDNTVFYISFANFIAEKAGLCENDRSNLIVNSNLIMELLDKRNGSPYKTFDYIGKFAELIYSYKNENFNPRISEYKTEKGLRTVVIEPPCGSNITVIESGEELFFVDSGFACYRDEMKKCLALLFDNFDKRRRLAAITHADVDHCGLLDMFDTVYLSEKCRLNFERERKNESNFREENELHSPYVRISKLLSKYTPPEEDILCVIGGSKKKLTDIIEKIGEFSCIGLNFEVYEGCGGHIYGEIILIEKENRLIFTGDIFVNIKEFTEEQAAFNKIAPYLMTSVDTMPETAASERAAIQKLLTSGKWLLLCGHGKAKEITIA